MAKKIIYQDYLEALRVVSQYEAQAAADDSMETHSMRIKAKREMFENIDDQVVRFIRNIELCRDEVFVKALNSWVYFQDLHPQVKKSIYDHFIIPNKAWLKNNRIRLNDDESAFTFKPEPEKDPKLSETEP